MLCFFVAFQIKAFFIPYKCFLWVSKKAGSGLIEFYKLKVIMCGYDNLVPLLKPFIWLCISFISSQCSSFQIL